MAHGEPMTERTRTRRKAATGPSVMDTAGGLSIFDAEIVRLSRLPLPRGARESLRNIEAWCRKVQRPERPRRRSDGAGDE